MALNIKVQVSRAVLLSAFIMTSKQSVAGNDYQKPIAKASHVETFQNTNTSYHASSIVDQHKVDLSKMFQRVNRHFDISNTAMDKAEINRIPQNTAVETYPETERGTPEEHVSIAGLETQNKTIQKRLGSSIPWLCTSQTNWKDLGSLHFPRFVKEVVCESESCMNGFYSCRSQFYQLRVLTTRERGDLDDVGLPLSLRPDWKFIDTKIAVGCMCGR